MNKQPDEPVVLPAVIRASYGNQGIAELQDGSQSE
jgi:hypothetical protein